MLGRLLEEGQVVPFLGAGASLMGRVKEEKWDSKEPTFLPSSDELAAFLADDVSFPAEGNEAHNLAKIASYYVDIGGRDELRRSLRRVLAREFHYNPLHEWLAEIQAPLVIVVTNYDTLLEQAFRAKDRSFDLLVYPADPEGFGESLLWSPAGADSPEEVQDLDNFTIEFGKRPLIFKMHGSVVRQTDRWDTFVITEEDYVDFLGRMVGNTAFPAGFYEHFRTRSFLFLGYSLSDWNLRVILNKLRRCLPLRYGKAPSTVPSWAIQKSPSELECSLWRNRDVKIFKMDLSEFVVHMRSQSGV